jgi:hypothetical protein
LQAGSDILPIGADLVRAAMIDEVCQMLPDAGNGKMGSLGGRFGMPPPDSQAA